MKMHRLRFAIGAVLSLAAVAFAAQSAFACACCSNRGDRYVETEKLGPPRITEIDRMAFATTASLLTGEADASIKGVDAPASDYTLAVTYRKDAFVFTFRDPKGRAGTLTLAVPQTISIFEVDPRGDAKDEGLGPSLYKEWKLTANAAGDGLFRQVTGAGQKITLVLHGRGRGCTNSSHFTDWTLLVYGRAGKLTLYGALDPAGR